MRTNEDITERKHAEQELRESEARFRALAESSPLAIFVNRDDRVFLANPACLKLFGASSPEELIGKPALELFDPDSRSLVRERIRVDSEEVPLVEVRILRLDGTAVDVEATASPFLDQGVKAIQVLLRDITERKQAEQELRESEARFRALAESSPLAIFVNRDDRVFLANPACLKLFGASSPEELLGKPALDLFDPDSRSLVRERIRVDSEEVPLVEVRILRLDGTAVDVEATASPFLDQGVKAIQVLLRDITERKQAEEDLRRSASFLENLIDYANAPIIVWGADLRVTRFNHAFERLTQRTADEVLGQPLDLLFPVDSRGASLEQTALAGRGASLEHAEVPILRADGEVRTVLWSSANVYDSASGGTLLAVIAQGQDITERKQAEEELRERTEELLASNTELEKFAYVASHDLQEPLRMVTNYTQLLQRRYQGKLDSDADEFIAYAVDGAARMRTLIDELLAYSRVGTQGAPFVLTALEGVLDDVLQGLEVALSEAGAVVSRDPLPELRCDKTQIARVFQNLIVNGVKFHGADPPAIHVGARREGEEWVFSVKDNGIGIDPGYFDRIFIIFQRLQSRVDYEGTGMGLAIGKRVIERHGGRIWVESLPGAGSTFYFTLPVEPKESE